MLRRSAPRKDELGTLPGVVFASPLSGRGDPETAVDYQLLDLKDGERRCNDHSSMKGLLVQPQVFLVFEPAVSVLALLPEAAAVSLPLELALSLLALPSPQV